MTGQGDGEAMRTAAREALRELLPELLRDALAAPRGSTNGHGQGDRHPRPTEAPVVPMVPAPPVVPMVPAPPVAAVLRPSTWAAAPAPGEVIGDPPPASPAADAGAEAAAEAVQINTDEELAGFVRTLAARMENPSERRAIQTGRVRFALRRRTAAAGPAALPGHAHGEAPALRLEKGAVTERIVREAATNGVSLVLGPGAVLTPLARDQARALGVAIERESRC